MHHPEYCWWAFLPHVINVVIFFNHIQSISICFWAGFTEDESAELSKVNLQCAIWNLFRKPHLQLNFSPASALSLKYTLNNNTNAYRMPSIKLILMMTIIISFKLIDWSQEIAKPFYMKSEFHIFHQKNNSLPMTNNSRATKTTCHESNEDRFSGCHI